MGLVRLESFLEDHIEGFFNKKFSSDLEPVELIKGLEREMAKYRKKKSVPNVYELTLSNEDYQRLCAQRIYDTLYTAIEKQVILADQVMDGTLRIHMHQQRRLTRGVFKLESAFHEQDDGECFAYDYARSAYGAAAFAGRSYDGITQCHRRSGS